MVSNFDFDLDVDDDVNFGLDVPIVPFVVVLVLVVVVADSEADVDEGFGFPFPLGLGFGLDLGRSSVDRWSDCSIKGRSLVVVSVVVFIVGVFMEVITVDPMEADETFPPPSICPKGRAGSNVGVPVNDPP